MSQYYHWTTINPTTNDYSDANLQTHWTGAVPQWQDQRSRSSDVESQSRQSFEFVTITIAETNEYHRFEHDQHCTADITA